jgi:hypothetical protein
VRQPKTCMEAACGKPARARGRCANCYARERRRIAAGPVADGRGRRRAAAAQARSFDRYDLQEGLDRRFQQLVAEARGAERD